MKRSLVNTIISVCIILICLNTWHSESLLPKKDLVSANALKTVSNDEDGNVVARFIPGNSVEIVKMPYGFEGRFNLDLKRYTGFLKLYHNGTLIPLVDNDSTTYLHDKENKVFPIVNKLRDNVFEVFIEVGRDPLPDQAELLRIENNKLIFKKEMPLFIAKASDLDGDGILEYAGPFDHSEEFDVKGIRYRSYDPIMYYKLTPNGIKLDTLLTKKRNAMIYGKLVKNRSDGTLAVPISGGVNERYLKEIKRIEANANK